MNMPIELYIMTVVWLLIDLVCRFMLKRNLYKLYMKKNDLKIRDGEYAIPQTSTFKELLEILDFEENKNVNDPIP
jgi:hypothetical protein